LLTPRCKAAYAFWLSPLPSYDMHALWREPQADDLERSRDARIARQHLERQQEYVALLRRAAVLRADGGEPPDPRLQELVSAGESTERRLRERSGGRIYPRKRPKKRWPTPEPCWVFLDECGSPDLWAQDVFPAFCLAAVIVRECDWTDVDLRVRTWKATNLGNADAIIHEPNVRRGDWPFNRPDRPDILESLRNLLTELDFVALACVIRRDAYLAEFGPEPLDESLPFLPYLMALDFLIERVVMGLDIQFNGAKPGWWRSHVVRRKTPYCSTSSPGCTCTARPTSRRPGSVSSFILASRSRGRAVHTHPGCSSPTSLPGPVRRR
jgi:hypothetical protein